MGTVQHNGGGLKRDRKKNSKPGHEERDARWRIELSERIYNLAVERLKPSSLSAHFYYLFIWMLRASEKPLPTCCPAMASGGRSAFITDSNTDPQLRGTSTSVRRPITIGTELLLCSPRDPRRFLVRTRL